MPELFVENDGQQGFIDFDSAVVFDEAEFSEFIHKEIHAGASGAYHFRQGLLGDLRKRAIRLILFAIAGEQEQGPGRTLFTGVEELIDQVFIAREYCERAYSL